jgi:hypothetical protein
MAEQISVGEVNKSRKPFRHSVWHDWNAFIYRSVSWWVFRCYWAPFGYLMTWMYKENSGKNRRSSNFSRRFYLFRFYSNFTNVDLQLPHKKQNASWRAFFYDLKKIQIRIVSISFFKAQRIWIAQIENLWEQSSW